MARLGCIVAVLVALAALAQGRVVAAGFDAATWAEQGWTVGYERGLARAHAAGRPAFVYFDAAWCSWCQQYKRDVLDTPSVEKALADGFVRVVVDFDARPDLMREHGGKGLPFTLVMTSDGAVLSRFVGVMPKTDLLDVLRAAAGSPERQSALTAGEVVHRPGALDRHAHAAFRAAWLRHLDALYDPARGTLTGQFETGTTFRRTALLTWLYLIDHDLWRERSARAARADRQRLWDPVDGGFFNFVDPTRGDYLESSKLLEVNAWMMAWQARAGRHDPAARDVAQSAWRYLREVLWDPARGGFFQSQIADNAYYALPPEARMTRPAPPVDRAKRADTNAQAAWALIDFARTRGNVEALDHAAATLDFVLRDLWHEGRLYHLWRDGRRFSPDLPHSLFWVLAAGAELERARPDAARRARLAAVAGVAGRWLAARMDDRAAAPLDVELAGLVAFAAGPRAHYAQLPAGARDWALGQLRIETETPPDEPVVGLRAWEARLAAPTE